MKFKTNLKQVFKETFLDLFQSKSPTVDHLESALIQAREGREEAADAMATFMVSHLRLIEAQKQAAEGLEELNQQLEQALSDGDDDRARSILKQRKGRLQEKTQLDERVAVSTARQDELKQRLQAMKSQVKEIEKRQVDLELRDSAATSIVKMSQAETEIEEQLQYASSPEAEEQTVLKEAGVELSDEARNDFEKRLEALVEEDELEQELMQLKQQRNA